MKGLIWFMSVFLALTTMSIRSGNDEKTQQAKIRVAVFDGHGGSQTCIWETLEALRLDPGLSIGTITSDQIASGGLDALDVLIIPGGSGNRQYLNLGAQNHDRIRRFVAKGKGAIGICAGAYLFTDTTGYASLALIPYQAIDIEHDNRGHGLVRFSLTDAGKSLFPELAKRSVNLMVYYEGPVLQKNKDLEKSSVLAIMESDVHEEGDAPANMTNNKPFFVANEYGDGRVFCSIAHPEATPGMRWVVPRMVRWVARGETPDYEARWVRPHLFDKEILFTKEMLKKEAALYQTLLYGREDEKVAALDWLQGHLSWDAKRWIQGLLYDRSPRVRQRAEQYAIDCELTMYLKDIEASKR